VEGRGRDGREKVRSGEGREGKGGLRTSGYKRKSNIKKERGGREKEEYISPPTYLWGGKNVSKGSVKP